MIVFFLWYLLIVRVSIFAVSRFFSVSQLFICHFIYRTQRSFRLIKMTNVTCMDIKASVKQSLRYKKAICSGSVEICFSFRQTILSSPSMIFHSRDVLWRMMADWVISFKHILIYNAEIIITIFIFRVFP